MPFQLAVFCPVPQRRPTVLALCTGYFELNNLNANVVTFSNAKTMEDEPFAYDAYLLALTPPSKTKSLPDGLLLAQKLRTKGMLNPIIFTANTPEWAYEAFRVNALQYLPSPLTADLFYPALEQALAPTAAPLFALNTATGICAIPFREIESVECTNHTLLFHRYALTSVQSLTLRVPLRTVLAPLLQDARFVQPHRSYVVNLAEVERLDIAAFVMKSGASIPVSRDRYPLMKEAYLSFIARTQDNSRTLLDI